MPPVRSLPTLDAIAATLRRHQPTRRDDLPLERKAAIAAIFREHAEGPQLLFILRAEHPRDPWSGHMAFPGGRVDPGDADPFAAAIRETREETGLDLDSQARLLGRLSEVRTHLRVRSAPLSVVPFAFALAQPSDLSINHEVQEAMWVPLSFLLDRGNRSIMLWTRDAAPLPMPCYRFDGRVIWGLTLRVVDELLELIGEAGTTE